MTWNFVTASKVITNSLYNDWYYTFEDNANGDIITITSANKLNGTIDLDAVIVGLYTFYSSSGTWAAWGNGSASDEANGDDNIEIVFACSTNGTSFTPATTLTWNIFTTHTYYTCVTGETKIATGFNGEYKLAEDIQLGDYVLMYDFEKQQIVLEQITKVCVRYADVVYQITFDDGSVLKLTGNHPMYTQDGWVCADYSHYKCDPHDTGGDKVEARSLVIGDKVKSFNKWKTIVSIEKIKYCSTVYDFSVGTNGNFYGDGTLLHNMPSPK